MLAVIVTARARESQCPHSGAERPCPHTKKRRIVTKKRPSLVRPGRTVHSRALILRVIFAAIYISGFNLKPANASGQRAQPLRSLVWTLSIVCLFMMGANLI